MIWTLIVGLIVGAIAKFLMPGKDPGGIVITMILGVAGAMLAHFIGTQVGWYESNNEVVGIISSVIGAIILLSIYRAVINRHGTITHN